MNWNIQDTQSEARKYPRIGIIKFPRMLSRDNDSPGAKQDNVPKKNMLR